MQKPTQERWLPIPGYEGRYEVSDQGRVRSLERRVRNGRNGTRINPEVILRAIPMPANRGGHMHLALRTNGKTKNWYVHNLVMLAFVGARPDDKTETRHLDGDPTNNRLENLRYGTAADNAADRKKHGTQRNARKTCCPQGHPYDEMNTRYWRDGEGRTHRKCRTCDDRHEAVRGRKKAQQK